MKHKQATSNRREQRTSATPYRFEIRANNDGTRTITGTAVVFGALSEDLGGFRERFRAGSFDESLRKYPDVIIANQHNLAQPLGRVSSGAKVWADDRGLHYSCKLPDTSWARDLIALLEGGIVSQNSFGFSVPPGGDDWTLQPDGTMLRTVTQAVLWECSVVTTPAYTTDENVIDLRSCPANLRSKLDSRDEDDADEDDDDPDCDSEIDADCEDDDGDDDDEDRKRRKPHERMSPEQIKAAHHDLLMLRLR